MSYRLRRHCLPPTKEEFKKIVPGPDGGDIFIDGTHCPVQRPSKKALRRMTYSGKKKRFTNNTNVYTNRDGVVIGISKCTVGSVGDITLLKERPMPFGRWEEAMHEADRPEGDRNRLYCDRGYQGIATHLPGTVPMIPYKKTRKTPLTREQRRHNSPIGRRYGAACGQHGIRPPLGGPVHLLAALYLAGQKRCRQCMVPPIGGTVRCLEWCCPIGRHGIGTVSCLQLQAQFSPAQNPAAASLSAARSGGGHLPPNKS